LLDAYKNAANLDKEDQNKHFQSLGQMSVITGNNLYNAQLALAVQQYLHNLSKAIADVASIADFLKSWDQKGWGENWGDTLEMLDTMEQRVRTLDSLTTNIGKGLTGSDTVKDIYKPAATPGGDKATQDAVNTARSGTVDVIKAIRKYKKEWKEGVSAAKAAGKVFNPSVIKDATGFLAEKEGLRKNVLGWVQKALVSYDEGLIKQRQQDIANLLGDQTAEDIARAQAFVDWQQAVRKLELAEEASNTLNQALPLLVNCMTKTGCPPSTTPYTRPTIPNFGTHWGDTLKALDPMIASLVTAITIPAVVNNCPPPSTSITEGYGPYIYGGSGSTLWCTFYPTLPIPLPLWPNPYGPMTVDPGPLTPPPGDPQTPGFAGDPYNPGPGPGNPWGPQTLPPNPLREASSWGIPQDPWNRLYTPGVDIPWTVIPQTTQRPPPSKTDQPNNTPVTPPPILINVKATSTAIQTGQNAVQLPGQQIKLYPTMTLNTDLPGTDDSKKNTEGGHDGDPVQGTTGGPDNSTTLKINPLDFGLKPGWGPGSYNFGFNVDPTRTSLVQNGPTGLTGQTPAQSFSVGGMPFSSYFLGGDRAQGLINSFPFIYDINDCRMKLPLAPGSERHMKINPRDALPSARLALP
jgi:hypothetical protein